jgi:hypothetical protein
MRGERQPLGLATLTKGDHGLTAIERIGPVILKRRQAPDMLDPKHPFNCR